MKTENRTFYMTLSITGILFADVDLKDSKIYKIEDLNKLGYRFIVAVRMLNVTTEQYYVVAIFEKTIS